MICDQVGDPTQVDPDPTCPLNHSYDRPTDRRILRPGPALVSLYYYLCGLIIFVNVALFAFLLTRPLDACACGARVQCAELFGIRSGWRLSSLRPSLLARFDTEISRKRMIPKRHERATAARACLVIRKSVGFTFSPQFWTM